MQFFNPFRISLGLLNLSVFSFKYIIFNLFFFLFCTPRHPRFSVPGDCVFFSLLCYVVYEYLYKKGFISAHSSAKLQVIQFSQSIQSSLCRSVSQVFNHYVSMPLLSQIQTLFSGMFIEFSWKHFHSANKRLSVILHDALQGLGINFL